MAAAVIEASEPRSAGVSGEGPLPDPYLKAVLSEVLSILPVLLSDVKARHPNLVIRAPCLIVMVINRDLFPVLPMDEQILPVFP